MIRFRNSPYVTLKLATSHRAESITAKRVAKITKSFESKRMKSPDPSTLDKLREVLEPGTREFVRENARVYALYPGRTEMPIEMSRSVGEKSRAPWAAGGPHATVHDFNVDVSHGTVKVRLLTTSPGPAKAALIYLHGGGWCLFSLDTHDRLMREYAHRADIAVFGIDYTRSPEAKFPRAIHEVVDCIRWIHSHANELGIDPTRLAIGGDSAGANLSVAACLEIRNRGTDALPQAMLLNYGVYDSDFSRPSYAKWGDGGFGLTRNDMGWFWDNYLDDPREKTNPLAAPIHADLTGLPSTHMTVTECDVLHDENVAMCEKLNRSGVAVESVIYPGTAHSFLEAVSISAASNEAFDNAARWLRNVLKGEAF